MNLLVAAFSLLVACAGWHYATSSNAGAPILPGELAGENQRRRRLRRISGGSMILLAIAFYAGVVAIDPAHRAGLFVACWLGTALLLLTILVLGLIDLRIVLRVRNRMKGKSS